MIQLPYPSQPPSRQDHHPMGWWQWAHRPLGCSWRVKLMLHSCAVHVPFMCLSCADICRVESVPMCACAKHVPIMLLPCASHVPSCVRHVPASSCAIMCNNVQSCAIMCASCAIMCASCAFMFLWHRTVFIRKVNEKEMARQTGLSCIYHMDARANVLGSRWFSEDCSGKCSPTLDWPLWPILRFLFLIGSNFVEEMRCSATPLLNWRRHSAWHRRLLSFGARRFRDSLCVCVCVRVCVCVCVCVCWRGWRGCPGCG